MNETTDGTGAGIIFFENDFVSLPLFCVIKVIIYGKGESSMLYIWSYLKKYPKWLALNLFSAVLFVIVNLGLPTILARMIDEGINPRDVDRLYFWGWVMFAIILLGIVGRIILSYAVGQLSYRSTRIASMSKLGYRHWSLA